MSVCRRCRSKQWRRHPADHHHHTCWRSHWDLQDDWQRSPRVDFTLLPTAPIIPSLIYVIKQAFLFKSSGPQTASTKSTLHVLAVPQSLPSTQHQTFSYVTCYMPPCSQSLYSIPKDWILSTLLSVLSFHGGFFFTFHTLCKLCCLKMLHNSFVTKSGTWKLLY